MFIRQKKVKGKDYYYAVEKKKGEKDIQIYLGSAKNIVEMKKENEQLKKKLGTLPYNL